MSDIHRRVFTLFLMEQDRLALNPAQRSEMQAHLSTCSSCQANLRLYYGIRARAGQRWREAAPQIDMEKVLRRVQVRTRGWWKTMPVQVVIWIGLGLLVLALAHWIFTDLRPTPAVQPPGGPTPTVPQPVNTPPANLDGSVKIPVEPLLIGEEAGQGTWSPQGDTFFVPLGENPAPGSDRLSISLHFISASSGADCPVSQTFLGAQTYQNYAWLDNEQVLFIDRNGRALLFTRCQDGSQDLSDRFGEPVVRIALPLTPQDWIAHGALLLETASAYWLLDPVTLQARSLADPVPSPGQADSFAWVPSGHQMSVVQPVAGKPDRVRLVILDLGSGQVLRAAEIEASTENGTPGIEWLGPERAFIGSGEPQLIDLSVDPPQQMYVIPALFGLHLSYPEDVFGMGDFYTPANGSYHIVLHTNLPEDKSIYIYHGEDGHVEKLPGDRPALLILPGDERMPLDILPDPPAYDDEYDLVWVDRPEQPPIHLQISGHTPRNYPNLQSRLRPGSTGILFGSTQGISLVGLPGGEAQAFWQLTGSEDSTLPSLFPAPNGRNLIVITNKFGSEAQGGLLYWLSLEATTTPQVSDTPQLTAATLTPQAINPTQTPGATPAAQVFVNPVSQISTYISLTIASPDDPTHAHWVDHFGGSVDIDGDILVSGAPIWGSPPGEGTGAAYVYHISPTGDWQPEATLIASDRDDGFQYDQHFGESVAVNGNVIAVGAPGYDDPQTGDNIGAVYIYEYDGHSWVETGKLTSSHPTPGAKIGRMLSFDGDLLAASGSPEAGFVSIFQHETDGWGEIAEVPVPSYQGDKPYVFIDLYGDTLALSTVTMPPVPETRDPKTQYQSLKTAGIVTLYERTDGKWTRIFQTTPQEASLYQMYEDTPFGLPISLTGEAGKASLLAVGKPGFTQSGRETGSVAIFERGEDGWMPQTEFTLASGEQVPGALPFFGPDPGVTFFGAFVEFEENRLAVISTFANTIYIFEHQDSGWVYRYLVTTGANFGDDFQRRTVAMSGDKLLLGSPGEIGAGAILVFSIP